MLIVKVTLRGFGKNIPKRSMQVKSVAVSLAILAP